MTIDLDELERIAAAATQGQWNWTEDDNIDANDDHVVFAAPCGYENSSLIAEKHDQRHIVAFQPRVALELVRALREAQGSDERMVAVMDGTFELGKERDRLRALLREALLLGCKIPTAAKDKRMHEIHKEAGL